MMAVRVVLTMLVVLASYSSLHAPLVLCGVRTHADEDAGMMLVAESAEIVAGFPRTS